MLDRFGRASHPFRIPCGTIHAVVRTALPGVDAKAAHWNRAILSNAPGSAARLDHSGAWFSDAARSWRVPTKPLVSTLSSPRRSVSPPRGRILTGLVHFVADPLAKPARTSRIHSVVNKDKPTNHEAAKYRKP